MNIIMSEYQERLFVMRIVIKEIAALGAMGLFTCTVFVWAQVLPKLF